MLKRNEINSVERMLRPVDFEQLAIGYYSCGDKEYEDMEQFSAAIDEGDAPLWEPFTNLPPNEVPEHCVDLAEFLHECYLKGVADGRKARTIPKRPSLNVLFITECDGQVEVTRVINAGSIDEAKLRFEEASEQPFTSVKVLNIFVSEGMPPIRTFGEVFDL